jgi:hypothetical protein
MKTTYFIFHKVFWREVGRSNHKVHKNFQTLLISLERIFTNHHVENVRF